MTIAADLTKIPADPGSDPGKPADDPGAQTALDAAKEKDKPPPFDQDPRWKSAREAEKNLQSLQAALGVDSVEELLEVADLGKALRAQDIDEDKIQKALAAQKEYTRVQAYWAETEEKQRFDQETIEDREKRLMAENAELKRKNKDEEERRNRVAERERVARDFDSEVKRIVTADPTIPENEKKFYWAFCGVENPTANIDIANKEAIRKAVPSVAKILKDFKDTILENAGRTKANIPRVPGAGAPADSGAPAIKNLKDARKTFSDRLKAVFNQ